MFASSPRPVARRATRIFALARRASEGETTCRPIDGFTSTHAASPSLARRASVFVAVAFSATPAGAQTVDAQPATPEAISVVAVAAGLSVVGAVVAMVFGRRMTAAIGVDGMTRIALLGALHFVVSFSAKILDALLGAVSGNFAVFVSGLGGEVFPSLIQAVTVAVVRRPGALALSNLTVSIMNGLCAGQLSPIDLWLALVGATLGELLLLATGATQWPGRGDDRSGKLPVAWTWRCAAALALFNGGTWLIQYSVYQVFNRLFLPLAFVVSVVLIVGVLYGGIGAFLGARWGVRLREIS
jgi:hypothetical protein